MFSKQHRQNTDFQLAYLMAGTCSTPDGAWNLMYGQKLAVENALKAGEIQRLNHKIKRLKAQRVLDTSQDEIKRLEAQRDILEADNAEHMLNLNEQGAKQELETIKKIMEQLEPLCRHDTSDPLAHQEAAQWDEWKGEFKKRVENMMLSRVLGIHYDHLEAMRAHPDFKTEILPHIISIGTDINKGLSADSMAALLSTPSNPLLALTKE